jgi:hypothetical protein
MNHNIWNLSEYEKYTEAFRLFTQFVIDIYKISTYHPFSDNIHTFSVYLPILEGKYGKSPYDSP